MTRDMRYIYYDIITEKVGDNTNKKGIMTKIKELIEKIKNFIRTKILRKGGIPDNVSMPKKVWDAICNGMSAVKQFLSMKLSKLKEVAKANKKAVAIIGIIAGAALILSEATAMRADKIDAEKKEINRGIIQQQIRNCDKALDIAYTKYNTVEDAKSKNLLKNEIDKVSKSKKNLHEMYENNEKTKYYSMLNKVIHFIEKVVNTIHRFATGSKKEIYKNTNVG